MRSPLLLRNYRDLDHLSQIGANQINIKPVGLKKRLGPVLAGGITSPPLECSPKVGGFGKSN